MRKPSIQQRLKQNGLRLNKEQLDAVKQLEGPNVVIAGAGTGKTSLLVAKINYANMVDPGCSVLAITFTKKSVGELQSRIVGNPNCMVSTFHSFFYRILRAYGYKSFRFLENDGQKRAMMKQVLETEGLADKLTVDDLEEALRTGRLDNEDTDTAVNAYFDQLKSKRVLCFDSLQYFCRELLLMNQAIAIRVRSFYTYVMIDEAQDMSDVQKEIIQLIWNAEKKPNITIVGDPKQSIYGFRGAAYGVMDELSHYYGAATHKLITNYRSTEVVLNLANEVLVSDEALKATRGKGKEVTFYAADNQKKEAEYIAEQIRLLHNSGTPLRDITILFRASHVVKDTYEALVRKHIPFVQIGSDPFKWHSSRFKCFLAVIAFMYDHDNSHYRCALPLLGLPKDITDDIEEGLNLPFSESLLGISSMSRKHRNVLQEYFEIEPTKYSLQDLTILVWEKYLKAYFRAEDNEILDDFLGEISGYNTFADLRSHINDVRRQVKQMQRLTANPNADYVRLMSIHTAKGLEFPVVFIVGAAEGILPDLTHDTVNIDEENRLAYVATTRAKDRLYVTYAKQCSKGNDAQPSRFFKQFFNN